MLHRIEEKTRCWTNLKKKNVLVTYAHYIPIETNHITIQYLTIWMATFMFFAISLPGNMLQYPCFKIVHHKITKSGK